MRTSIDVPADVRGTVIFQIGSNVAPVLTDPMVAALRGWNQILTYNYTDYGLAMAAASDPGLYYNLYIVGMTHAYFTATAQADLILALRQIQIDPGTKQITSLPGDRSSNIRLYFSDGDVIRELLNAANLAGFPADRAAIGGVYDVLSAAGLPGPLLLQS